MEQTENQIKLRLRNKTARLQQVASSRGLSNDPGFQGENRST
jgi:hypothetical protein